jgi:hypothetical protein
MSAALDGVHGAASRLAVSIGGVGDVRRGGEGPDRALSLPAKEPRAAATRTRRSRRSRANRLRVGAALSRGRSVYLTEQSVTAVRVLTRAAGLRALTHDLPVTVQQEESPATGAVALSQVVEPVGLQVVLGGLRVPSDFVGNALAWCGDEAGLVGAASGLGGIRRRGGGTAAPARSGTRRRRSAWPARLGASASSCRPRRSRRGPPPPRGALLTALR